MIDEAQAAGVHRLFTLIAEGNGLQKSAKIMNAENIAAPRGRWSGSTIRAMVFNDLYRGVAVYGRTRWEDRGEKKVKIAVPTGDWIRKELPELRLVDEELWTAGGRFGSDSFGGGPSPCEPKGDRSSPLYWRTI